MHLIITDAWLAKSRAIHLTGVKLIVVGLALSLGLVSIVADLYHWVFIQGATEGWPVLGALVRPVAKDEVAQRDRFVRENLDAMARKVGEMQAKLIQLEALGERVSGLAGVNPRDIKNFSGRGGVFVPGPPMALGELQAILSEMDSAGTRRADFLTLVESRLFDQKIRKLMLPTQQPVLDASLGSGFGWRIDPFTGRSALHTGLDFSADQGAPIFAAAGGAVVMQEYHAAYGNMIEIDHGNDLVSRYAHASRVFAKKGDLVRRGQKIAEIGTTGRSTGPHLHFEVLVQGVQQDPWKFLTAGQRLPSGRVARVDIPASSPPPSQR